MRRLDWFLAAVIGLFLAWSLAAQTLSWASLDPVGDESATVQPAVRIVERIVSGGARPIISAAWPTISRRP